MLEPMILGAEKRVLIAGGGAAGMFAAIACAEGRESARVVVVERSPEFLTKVRISGGGRCNVTHSCFDALELSESYPRGGKALIGAFHRFQPRDTIEWFEKRGIRLKTEPDGRMFPVSDRSETIVDCLLESARAAGVELIRGKGIQSARRNDGGGFAAILQDGSSIACEALMLATGGCRAPGQAEVALSLGHTLVPPVPSLFAFELDEPWLTALAGISLGEVEVALPDEFRRGAVAATRVQRGGLVITHSGISGPAVLRLSAWGARELHAANYRLTTRINWRPQDSSEELAEVFERERANYPARRIANSACTGLPGRLWEALAARAGIPVETRWADLSSAAKLRLVSTLRSCQVMVRGKSLNKEEFVTCGGIPLNEVNFKTMESRVCPGLYFGGEILDIDAVTGGFNFQAAWTTGWIAGKAMRA